MAGKPLVSGPGYSGPKQPLSATEREIAQEEARTPPTPAGRDAARDYTLAHEAQGKDESGVPEQLFHGEARDDTPIVTRNGMRERMRPEVGIGFVSDELKRKYGINPEKEYVKFEHENDYLNRGVNYLDDWLADNPSGRVPTFNGEPYKMKGEVMVCVPMEVQQSIWDDYNQGAKEFIEGASKKVEKLTEEQLEKRRDETSKAITKMIAGSPTAGKDLDWAASHIDAADAEREREEFAWRGIASKGSERRPDNRANAVDQAVETLKSSATGRATHAMGAHIDSAGNVVRA